ncbi:hypothetical protein [Roseimaritima ulvae]|uniref:Transmembrane protein n=1 Tax=Roseimaritima ulvae TaxID=980254 RepID=A0A5B9QN85_9BACT|nr:hypothetical protein [Roseimaritima ulvae]QEG39100.1 hypothetical protein UC8_10610 [Roseimaritima ulvae]
MNREDKDHSTNSAEDSAIEAALAQLRPRREARFADDIKSRARSALLGESSASESPTATVKVPLTHYIRIAQFNAAASGLLVGLLFGFLLGGTSVFFVLDRIYTQSFPPAQSRSTTASPLDRMLLVNEASLTPQERALFDELKKELHDGR